MSADGILPVALAAVAAMNAWVLWLATQARAERKALSDRLDADRKAAADAAAAVRADLERHRLEVAKDYVSRDSLRELEERLVAAIERLGDRLDRVLDRRAKPSSGSSA